MKNNIANYFVLVFFSKKYVEMLIIFDKSKDEDLSFFLS